MSPFNHNQVQLSRSLHSFTYIFSLRQDLSPKFSPLHAVCVPCPQPSPTRACTGDHPPSAPVWMCSQHPSTVPASSEARQTSLGLAHAREASSSEPPSTERCAGLLTRRNISTGWASRWTDPTRAGTLLDALELGCLCPEISHVLAPLSAPLSSTPRSPPRRQSSRAGRAPGHHFTREGQQPLP